MNVKYNRRALDLARSTERRLQKLPGLIRREFHAGSDRQLSALAKIERAIELVSIETRRHRHELEQTLKGESK